MISMPKKNEIAVKHAKKFASKSETTPVLCGIHYAEDGHIYVTDRHRLLRIRDAHTYTTPVTSHVVTGAELDGKFPDCSRLIPSAPKTTFVIEGIEAINQAVKYVKLALDVAKTVDKSTKICELFGSDQIRVGASDGVNVKFSAYLAAGGCDTVRLNCEYLYDALNVFKDAGTRQINVCITGAMSPILLTDEENGIDVLVLPYRTTRGVA